MAGWGAIALTALPAWAQLELIPDTAPDRSLNTQVIQNALPSGDVITGGTRSQNGQNLFHSFQAFNIRENRGVYFQNPTGVQNILTRVTGSDLSNILGTLGVLGNANLFFLNPNGIIFGPNARLQISGSFFATTANSLRFSDGSEFSANNSLAPPLLTVNITPGLQTGTIPPDSTITNRGNLTTGQDLVLEGDRLDLQGQLVAERDLTLKAHETIQIRDTVTSPFLASSGRDLTIQGIQGIDILALQHPQTPVQSGRNLSLISDGVISGDAHFFSGGAFQIRSVSGQLATFTSLYDPIISSAGNVDIAANYGAVGVGAASLLIESQSNVRIQGSVVIEAPDTVSAFVGNDAILQTQPGLIIRAGQSTLVYGGTNQNNPPAFTNGTVSAGITLEGAVRVQPNAQGGIVRLIAANSDIRTNSIDASSATGFDGGAINLSAGGNISAGVVTTAAYFGANAGAVSVLSAGGNISLNGVVSDARAGFPPGGSTAGNGGAITVRTNNGSIFIQGGVDTSSGAGQPSGSLIRSGNGGAISLSATNGDVVVTNGGIFSNSRVGMGPLFGTSSTGNGGAITISAINGNIFTRQISSSTTSSSILASANSASTSGNAGSISLTATNGNVVTGNLDAFALTTASSTSFFPTSGNTFSGNGGEIAIATSNGDITTGNINSFSFASPPADQVGSRSGNGGTIQLAATNGNIPGSTAPTLASVSLAVGGQSGNGGDVILTAQNTLNNLELLTLASSAKSGNVEIRGLEDAVMTNNQVITSKQLTVNIPNREPVILNIGNEGQSGNVSVTSAGNLTLTQSSIQTDTKGSDAAGNVVVSSPGSITFNSSQIVSNTSSTGAAGNVSVQAGQSLTLTNNSQLSATTSSSGSAGSITLNAPTLNVIGNAQIVAETQGEGRGGNITIDAPTTVNLTRVQDTSPVLSVEASGAGKAGDILINTPSLTLADRARITATATASATNPEGGGSIILNASTLNLAGIVGVFAETQGQAPAGTLNLNPYNSQADLNIALTPNSQISASTSGSGNGGDLRVSAPRSITIAGPGKLAVETNGAGNAGNMTITTSQLNLTNGVELSVSTFGVGRAGEVQINADDLTIASGARILTNTSGSGPAGDLTVNVIDRLLLTDPGTGLFASTTPGSTGNGGNIIIDPRLVQIENGAVIAVDSQGSGTGGSISLRAGRLELRDRGSITAETASAQGGNITLDVQDLILLRRNSLISATAGTAQAAGDGGNITIRSSFIIGVLSENSDITANAFTGRGGNISITTNAIFGLLPQARLTPFSDITASSEFGLSGTIAINTLNVDPNRGLVALPTNFTDPSRQIREACTPRSTAVARKSSFVVTGRGGLPASPEAVQTGDRPLVDLVSVVPTNSAQASAFSQSPVDAADKNQAAIVEAQTWITEKDGTVLLTAHTNLDSVQPPDIPLPTCISR